MRPHEDPDATWDEMGRSNHNADQDSQVIQVATELLAELTATPLDQLADLIAAPRFRDPMLLELLLELSHHEQLRDPVLAEELALIAARLATLLADESQPSTVAAALPRALCLGANARRLADDPLGADALLAQVAPFIELVPERAFYSRVAALVRWHEGRLDESVALLQYVSRLHRAQGQASEEGVCQALLGMVLYEDGRLGDPLSPLQHGWTTMRRDARPHLALRAGMTLAACQAERLHTDRAQQVLREAWSLYSLVSDEEELLRDFWLEGRVLARLGSWDEAIQVLESVRLKLLKGPYSGESALVCMDLVPLLATVGRSNEIEGLASALALAKGPVELAGNLILNLAAVAKTDQADLNSSATGAARSLRRAMRASGGMIRPLPFF